jgi:dTDP-4-dehydrorhamnose reductase
MTKILITGSRGFLGSNLSHFLSGNKDYDIFLTSRSGKTGVKNPKQFFQGDLLDTSFVEDMISTIEPDVVFNTVSLVNVDLCEENPGMAENIIVDTARVLTEAISGRNCHLIHISTDQLFDGQRKMYTETDIPAPLNVYGAMKLKAEDTILQVNPRAAIIRTNFIGWSPAYHPPTFAEWIYQSLAQKKPITLFTDLYFCPIEVTYMAAALESVMHAGFGGILNLVGSERCSKYDFGMALARKFNLDPSMITASKVQPGSFKAKRQMDLSLSTKKYETLFGRQLPGLEESISRFYENREIRPLLGS